jgi:hypothetical protein
LRFLQPARPVPGLLADGVLGRLLVDDVQAGLRAAPNEEVNQRQGGNMKRIIVSIAAMLALAVTALPAGAAATDPTGVKFSVLGGGTERAILANTAFYVKHGFRIVDGDSTPAEIQQSSVTVSVDGVAQKAVILQEFTDTKPKTLVGKFSLVNFPNGLAVGTHSMTVAFGFRGEVILTRNFTLYSLATCEYGTFDGLQCSPPA